MNSLLCHGNVYHGHVKLTDYVYGSNIFCNFYLWFDYYRKKWTAEVTLCVSLCISSAFASTCYVSILRKYTLITGMFPWRINPLL